MKTSLSVICIKCGDGVYFAECPEIPGCYTQGDTYEDAMKYLRELVEATIAEDLDDDDKRELLDKNREKQYILSEMLVNV